ncbi:MAG TPA: PrsW family glutamic-type intramembrane protease [Candidatus Paceibacterota bacterium]|jgi:RsiW-degrading membrane proteinase PrsW (M82 family)|nr:PrsW family glutamic-type intramembrane protease [Candidatus Paceibacterota bacterium]
MTLADTWIFAGAGGLLPAMLWLLFWLREDAKHPEPKVRIASTFLAGMVAVIAVLPLERATARIVSPNSPEMFLVWAFFEESLKLLACGIVALRSRDVDEPIDPIIYMITAALGFSALENALFLLNPLAHGQILETIITGNMRFLGANLLHVISSSAIGVFMALSFYGRKMWKRISIFAGLLAATALHTLFNLFIIKETNNTAFATFGVVWLAIIVLMILFEKVKSIYPRKKKYA